MAQCVHGAMTFTDYFVLLEVDGAWKIANKAFYGEST
ncbi:MAG: nuclear transport factor 2 family protein [Trueperaceae bacterium]